MFLTKNQINIHLNCKKYNISKDKLNIEYFIQGSRKDKPTIGGLRETFAELYASIKKNGYDIINKEYKGVIENLFPNTAKYVTKLLILLGDKV